MGTLSLHPGVHSLCLYPFAPVSVNPCGLRDENKGLHACEWNRAGQAPLRTSATHRYNGRQGGDEVGSRLMHLLVADYVCRELNITERPAILLGSIAPDAANPKRASHFKGERHPYADNPPLDFGRFVAKYRDCFPHPFFVGYLTHLVMDDVWTMKTDFSGFEKRIQQDPTLYTRYHHDLWLCNAKLLQRYNMDGVEEALRKADNVPAMEEVDKQAVLDYKREALADFQYPPENVDSPLQVFSFEEMVQYVERSKAKALDICRMVL
jgi:hypothetical protein